MIVMVAGCLISLPYTLGRSTVRTSGSPAATGSDDRGAIEPRRYEATAPDLSLLPPSWSRYAPDERDRREAFRAQSGRDPRPLLGTDKLGRDLFIRCLAGGGISLAVGISAALISVIIGTCWGTVAGFFGGRLDAVMMRIVDILYGLPYILLVVLLAVAVDGIIENVNQRVVEVQRLGGDGSAISAPAWLIFLQVHRQLLNVITLFVAIGAVSWLTMARVIRGQVLSLKQQPFMEACRAIGVPMRRQFLRHLLPNLLGPIIVYSTLTVPQAILSESFLSFLGIGVREPLPSWGNLAAAGLSELNTVRVRWWLIFWPCLFIGVTLLALNFFGEAVREAFDPRRRKAGPS